jgi:hypothetical protein
MSLLLRPVDTLLSAALGVEAAAEGVAAWGAAGVDGVALAGEAEEAEGGALAGDARGGASSSALGGVGMGSFRGPEKSRDAEENASSKGSDGALIYEPTGA